MIYLLRFICLGCLGFICYDFWDLFVRIFEIYLLGFFVGAYR